MSDEVAIISDIHGNLQALQAVLRDIEKRGITERVCLGDIVGYGGNPAECVELVRSAGCTAIRGNHDTVVGGDDDLGGMGEHVRDSIARTRRTLSVEQRAWLAGLPLTCAGEDYEAVHASLHHPGAWRYLLTPDEVALHFANQVKPVCFVGHTHQPKMWVEGQHAPVPLTALESLRPDRRQVVNVGSVGQPRDRDERACYVVYRRKERDVWWRRPAYDIASAQRAVLEAGMPARYAARLAEGR